MSLPGMKSVFLIRETKEEDVEVDAKNVHIDLSPHEHDDVYEGADDSCGVEEKKEIDLAPEQEKVVKRALKSLKPLLGDGADMNGIAAVLRKLIVGSEEAEGEDASDVEAQDQ